MSRRFTRLSLLLVFMLSSEVWAIGLGDINLDSALNEPLRAEISLLSATPEELLGLSVSLASAETFERYGIERPFFLQGLEFKIINGGVAGSVVQIRSRAPITEPFLTFLVEANWPSGRLLREYTVLLDPPTFAPPPVQQPAAVSAPQRATPSDAGRIQQAAPAQPAPAPAQQSRPAPQPSQPAQTSSAATKPLPAADDIPYDGTPGADLTVERGDTLWGIAARMRADNRLSMNQKMVAIFEANRDAFGGNINMLRAGANLRIPSSDSVFQINRGDALSEVQRQNSAWGGESDYVAPAPTTRPSLTLVPPDEEPAVSDYSDDTSVYEPVSREQEIEDLIAELEAADVPDQQSLIEIRDNNLANLRQELANIRGEVYEPPVTDDPFVDGVDDRVEDDEAADETSIEDLFPDQSEITADDSEDDAFVDEADDAADDAVADGADDTPAVVTTPRAAEKGIVDQILEFVTGTVGMIIIGAVALVLALLVWFARRGGGDDDEDIDRPWERLDDDDMAAGSLSSTESMQAPTPEEAFVVVEQDSGVHPVLEDDTIETPAAAQAPVAAADPGEATGQFGSLEDTFSSETAVNLDQTDPIAEADFHMAYGLYDQAADLVNEALETDPADKGLMSKLCEIYFVWGNRDSFVDAASRLKSIVGDGGSADWDKIVIMGQQIAADHELFAGAEVAGATKAVDLAFDDDGDQAGALDMDFGADDSGSSDIVDLGAGDDSQEDVDFMFGETAAGDEELDMALEPTAESPTMDVPDTEKTAEMPSPTVETPTIEEQFEGFGEGTSELPSLDESLGQAISDSGQGADATAEINLDELDLDVDGLAETELASLDDLDATGQNETLSDTGINQALEDAIEATGKNPELDPNSTGIREGLDISDFDDLDATGEMRLAPDETGRSPMLDADQGLTDVGIDETLLDATGHTQILSDDMAVETAADLENVLGDAEATQMAPGLGDDETIEAIPDEAETLLAPMDDDEDDFDFAKTEALPVEAFSGDDDETAGTVALAGTDVDLDLDDLTAALQVSEIGDTVQQPRDDATVEQPRPSIGDETAAVPTMNLSPEDMSDDLQEARTMTEVGTKLDLARAYVDMGDPAGARSILEEVLDEGDESQKQQAQQLLDTLPS